MDRKLTMILAMLVFFAALAYQISKTETDGGRIARLARIRKMMDEGRPVYNLAQEAKKAKFEHRAQRLAGLIDSLSEQIEKKTTAKPVAKKKETKKDDKKKVAKKDDKKKKKKKKAEPTQETEVAKSDDDKSSDSNDSFNASQGGGAYAEIRNQMFDPNRGPQTIEEWIAYLAGADHDRTSEFIRAYQSASMTSDIFYGVIDLMLKDPREPMRELAAMALGSTHSAPSFTKLFAIRENGKETKKVREQAEEYLANYREVAYVRYLHSIIKNRENKAASSFALSLLTDAAQTEFQRQQEGQPSGSGSGGNPQSSRANASNARVFRPFESTLESLVKSGQDEAELPLRLVREIASAT
ncbi:MAG TPA: hypothetical protein VM432_03250 [Bdellovibrionales bacterium]|nr:hypothetical protein [Bdellovibrionales bacterium]